MGAETAWVARSVVTWRPSEPGDATVIYERGDSDGDGPATQNRRRFRGFDFSIDEPGFSRVDWQHVIVEANRRVGSGGGLVTNVLGWREVKHASLADIDSTTEPLFHLFAYTGQRQVSNELRYSGWLRPGWEVTLGAYAFAQDIRYRERRLIRTAWGMPFGGDQEHRTGGVFLNNDIELGGAWVLTVGARYTLEDKDVRVATAGNSVCARGIPPMRVRLPGRRRLAQRHAQGRAAVLAARGDAALRPLSRRGSGAVGTTCATPHRASPRARSTRRSRTRSSWDSSRSWRRGASVSTWRRSTTASTECSGR